MNITRKDLAKAISNDMSITSELAEDFINSFAKVVKEEVKRGSEVTIRQFGTFKAKQYAEKTARNISTGAKVIVPARKRPVFVPSKIHFNLD